MPYGVNEGDVVTRIGGVAAQVLTADALGAAIDLQDYEGELIVLLNSAAGTGNADNTLAVNLKESDTSGGSYTDVAGGAFSAVSTAASAQKISVNSDEMKRYVKFNLDVGGTTPSFVMAAELLGIKKNPA